MSAPPGQAAGTGRIEDYAVIGNCETMALVGLSGSIDWLCLPRFDSASCFTALLGDRDNGRWVIEPLEAPTRVTRSYDGDTLILTTLFEGAEGSASVTDFMSRREEASDIVRIVRGVSGRLRLRTEIVVRFDYGLVMPWVSRDEAGRLHFVAGPDRLVLDSPVVLEGRDFASAAEFEVGAGDVLDFRLSWSASYLPAPPPFDALEAETRVRQFWAGWASRFQGQGVWADAVLRSLLTLKGLAHWRTGGIVAAATASLPEKIGGARNWDYRYCWLRDATFTLYALTEHGFLEEAAAWRDWLVRAVAGNPSDLQIMYGLAGERRLDERTLGHLAGYQGSSPVRIGNAAAGQLQLDVFGEVLDAFFAARQAGLGQDDASWALETALIEHLETLWREPDDGIWEVRGDRRHFTHSKVMAWVAFDRAARSVETFGLAGPAERWRGIADEIHAQVCEHGVDSERGCFVQSYGSDALDASLLLIPLVGFLPPEDPRVRATLKAIETDLVQDGLVLRYASGGAVDGLPPGEGCFLACSFWLIDNYLLQGRRSEGEAVFERLMGMRNDVGLLAEEYDPVAGRQLGNFPQAFSHLALVNSAYHLASGGGRVHPRRARSTGPSSSPGRQPGPHRPQS